MEGGEQGPMEKEEKVCRPGGTSASGSTWSEVSQARKQFLMLHSVSLPAFKKHSQKNPMTEKKNSYHQFPKLVLPLSNFFFF